MSEKKQYTLVDLFHRIQEEMEYQTDKHRRDLFCAYIELFFRIIVFVPMTDSF